MSVFHEEPVLTVPEKEGATEMLAPPVPPVERRKRWPWVVAGLVVVALLLAGGVWWLIDSTVPTSDYDEVVAELEVAEEALAASEEALVAEEASSAELEAELSGLAALDELAGSVEMVRDLADAAPEIWRESADGTMVEVWSRFDSSWRETGLTIAAVRQEGSSWVHLVEDSPEQVMWVWFSVQTIGLNQDLVDSGVLPADPLEDLRITSAVLALDGHRFPGEFRIDCTSDRLRPAVALVLTTDDERTIARAWTDEGRSYLPASEVTCG